MKTALALLILLAVGTTASAADKPDAGRAAAVAVLKYLRHITSPNGVERAEKVRIGGIDQWVTIRGRDRRNPVLLVLHGGPGYVLNPMNWWFQPGWEEYFTVVEWDQRGAGKTLMINDRAKLAPTITN